jgi:hypothetical protein
LSESRLNPTLQKARNDFAGGGHTVGTMDDLQQDINDERASGGCVGLLRGREHSPPLRELGRGLAGGVAHVDEAILQGLAPNAVGSEQIEEGIVETDSEA